MSYQDFKRFMAGGTAAGIAKTVVAPFERVKLILQLQEVSGQIKTENQFNGIIDAFVRIPREQGFFSLWRGNLANVIRYFPAQGMRFAFKDLYRSIFTKGVDKEKQFWKYFAMNLASGGAAGGTTLCFVHPLDFARTRLGMDTGRNRENRMYQGIMDCLIKTWKKDGIPGLYKGFAVSVGGAVAYRATYFGFFDTAKVLLPKQDDSHIIIRYIIAQVGTNTAGIICYPLDTIRRRMMMQVDLLPGQIPRYKNAWHCVFVMAKEEGFRAFYKGALINVFRGIGAALVLTLYDEINKYF